MERIPIWQVVAWVGKSEENVRRWIRLGYLEADVDYLKTRLIPYQGSNKAFIDAYKLVWETKNAAVQEKVRKYYAKGVAA